jgi:ATP-dependent protease ClpP protease subunit
MKPLQDRSFINWVCILIAISLLVFLANGVSFHIGGSQQNLVSGSLHEEMAYVKNNTLYLTLYGNINQYNHKELSHNINWAINNLHIEKIFLDLNSPGGTIFSGLGIIESLLRAKERGIHVTVQAAGRVASMAVPVMAIGDHRIAAPSTIFMVHPPQMSFRPNTPQSKIDSIKQLTKMLIKVYLDLLNKQTNLNQEEWRELMFDNKNEGTWFDVKKALRVNLIDEIK